ncbi:MAG: N,N-dimethylformamidase [Proteobacteria bacterium]|nr:N,N-dimethylformamidase [Pseudomonadota bacterium]
MPELRRKTITGYCEPISVRPGQSLDFKVCCYEGGASPRIYEADLVHVTGGDNTPGGIGVIEEVLAAPFAGPHPGRYQAIHTGSHGIVDEGKDLAGLHSFTLQAMIQPTLPGRQQQVVMGRWRADEIGAGGAGFALLLDDDGALALAIGEDEDGAGRRGFLSTGVPMRRGQWAFVAASYDGASGRARLVQRPVPSGPGDSLVSPATERTDVLAKDLMPGAAAALFLFAAGGGSSEAAEFTRHFNGKIDRPRLADRALNDAEMAALSGPALPGGLIDCVRGCWDFAADISSDRIRDLTRHGRHGRVVNLPTRGVTGHNWDGGEHSWRHAREQYGAIHFHQDDLYDAAWQTDFSYTVPDDLPSGVYAARLRHGSDVDRMPFFVLPPRVPAGSRARTDVALLVPTASYMAYANTRQRLKPNLIFGDGHPEWVNDGFLAGHPEVGGSLYDLHDDRSGIHYSSRLRPVMNMKPGDNRPWGLPADLNIVAWLTRIGQTFDVITDEELHREGAALLQPYRCILTGSHPEYHSTAMLDGIAAFLDQGGRLMYLGGNGFYWRIAFRDDKPGVIEVRRAEDGTRAWMSPVGEYYQSFDGEYGGLWRRNGRPPNQLVGIGFAAQGFEKSGHYERQSGADDPRAAFAFAGVGTGPIGDFGSIGGGAAGEEIDRWDTRDGTPIHALVLARANDFGGDMLRTKEDFLSTMPQFDDPNVRADMVFFECPRGGAVFATGSIAWISSLAHEGYANNVAQITGNVLRRFLEPTPFSPPPGAD